MSLPIPALAEPRVGTFDSPLLQPSQYFAPPCMSADVAKTVHYECRYLFATLFLGYLPTRNIRDGGKIIILSTCCCVTSKKLFLVQKGVTNLDFLKHFGG